MCVCKSVTTVWGSYIIGRSKGETQLVLRWLTVDCMEIVVMSVVFYQLWTKEEGRQCYMTPIFFLIPYFFFLTLTSLSLLLSADLPGQFFCFVFFFFRFLPLFSMQLQPPVLLHSHDDFNCLSKPWCLRVNAGRAGSGTEQSVTMES